MNGAPGGAPSGGEMPTTLPAVQELVETTLEREAGDEGDALENPDALNVAFQHAEQAISTKGEDLKGRLPEHADVIDGAMRIALEAIPELEGEMREEALAELNQELLTAIENLQARIAPVDQEPGASMEEAFLGEEQSTGMISRIRETMDGFLEPVKEFLQSLKEDDPEMFKMVTNFLAGAGAMGGYLMGALGMETFLSGEEIQMHDAFKEGLGGKIIDPESPVTPHTYEVMEAMYQREQNDREGRENTEPETRAEFVARLVEGINYNPLTNEDVVNRMNEMGATAEDTEEAENPEDLIVPESDAELQAVAERYRSEKLGNRMPQKLTMEDLQTFAGEENLVSILQSQIPDNLTEEQGAKVEEFITSLDGDAGKSALNQFFMDLFLDDGTQQELEEEGITDLTYEPVLASDISGALATLSYKRDGVDEKVTIKADGVRTEWTEEDTGGGAEAQTYPWNMNAGFLANLKREGAGDGNDQ